VGQRQRWRNYSVAVVNDKRRYGDASRPVTSVSTSGLYRIGQSAIIDGVPANNNEPINSWPNRPKNRPARLPLDRRPARPARVTGPTTRPARPARVTGPTTRPTGPRHRPDDRGHRGERPSRHRCGRDGNLLGQQRQAINDAH